MKPKILATGHRSFKIGDTVTVKMTGIIDGYSTLYPKRFIVRTPYGITAVVKPGQLERVK